MLDASDNNMFGKKAKAGITAWADALNSSSSLTQLNLAENTLNANDVKIIATAISSNKALTSLNLGSNGLGAKGAKHIAEAITANVSVLQFA